MTNHDWPPKNEPKQDLIKFLTPETIQDVSDRIIGVEQLKAILLAYSPGLFNGRSEITKETIGSAVEIFLTKYPNIGAYKEKARPYNAEELLEEFPEIKEDTQAFKTIMYGKDGNISYQLKPKADQESITEDFPSVADAPDFQSLSETSELRQVKFKRDSLKICREIFDDPQLKNELKFILADFTDFDEGRDAIDLSNLLGLVNKFLSRYDSLDRFEKEGNIKHFLATLGAGDKRDEQANKAKQDKYAKVMMRFEDIMFGHHIER